MKRERILLIFSSFCVIMDGVMTRSKQVLVTSHHQPTFVVVGFTKWRSETFSLLLKS